MHTIEMERIEQVEMEERQIPDIIHQLRIFRAAEARMVGGNDIEMAGERLEPRLLPIEPLRAVQEQQRLAFAHAPDIDLAAAHVDQRVLYHVCLAPSW
jgi:hypothetical protein